MNQKTNKENLTWSEWAYAAGVKEPYRLCTGEGTASHDQPGYARFFVKERKAWRTGEDPSEWRAGSNGPK